MKTETVKFEVGSAYGKEIKDYNVTVDGKVVEKLAGSFKFEAYENKSEIKEADLLTDKEYTQAVNAKNKAAERAKATTALLTANGINKPDQNDPEVIKENSIRATMKQHGVDRETAIKIQEQNAKMIEEMRAQGLLPALPVPATV